MDSRNRNDLKRIRGDKITWISGTENGVSNIAYLINQVLAVSLSLFMYTLT